MMKLLNPKFLVIALIAIAFTACSGDDDNGPTTLELTNANLAGTYDIVFFEGNGETTTTVQGTEVVVGTVEFFADTFTNAIFTFTENGTWTSSGSFRQTTTTTIGDNDPEETSEIVIIEEETLNYSVNTSEDTITVDGQTWTVTRFTADDLYLTLEEVDVEGDTTSTLMSEIRLERQN